MSDRPIQSSAGFSTFWKVNPAGDGEPEPQLSISDVTDSLFISTRFTRLHFAWVCVCPVFLWGGSRWPQGPEVDREPIAKHSHWRKCGRGSSHTSRLACRTNSPAEWRLPVDAVRWATPHSLPTHSLYVSPSYLVLNSVVLYLNISFIFRWADLQSVNTFCWKWLHEFITSTAFHIGCAKERFCWVSMTSDANQIRFFLMLFFFIYEARDQNILKPAAWPVALTQNNHHTTWPCMWERTHTSTTLCEGLKCWFWMHYWMISSISVGLFPRDSQLQADKGCESLQRI